MPSNKLFRGVLAPEVNTTCTTYARTLAYEVIPSGLEPSADVLTLTTFEGVAAQSLERIFKFPRLYLLMLLYHAFIFICHPFHTIWIHAIVHCC